jgi:hypothetical protein
MDDTPRSGQRRHHRQTRTDVDSDHDSGHMDSGQTWTRDRRGRGTDARQTWTPTTVDSGQVNLYGSPILGVSYSQCHVFSTHRDD